MELDARNRVLVAIGAIASAIEIDPMVRKGAASRMEAPVARIKPESTTTAWLARSEKPAPSGVTEPSGWEQGGAAGGASVEK